MKRDISYSTMRNIRNSITEKYESIPEAQISPGLYLVKVGYKFVHILNTWEHTRLEKMEILDFWDRYMVNY